MAEVPALMAESDLRSPYPGPRPFEADDRTLFFGRQREVNDLVSLLIAHPVTLLYSQSGAGKTSLLKAGLIPALANDFEVLPVTRVKGSGKIDQPVPNVFIYNAISAWSGKDAGGAELVGLSLADYFKRQKPAATTLPRALIFDQFEELFTFYPERWKDRKGFFEQVVEILDSGLVARVMFSMREDYIAQLDPHAPLLPERFRIHYRLERLREAPALQAIREPLKGTERRFADGAAEKLVQDLLEIHVEGAPGMSGAISGEFVEPVQLQVVCQTLWRDLPQQVAVITEEHLSAFADVNRALSGFYNRCLEAAAKKAGISPDAMADWVERCLITPAGTRGTVYRGQEQTGGLANAAMDLLENEHLIRAEWRAGARWYELAHDRFITPIQRSNRARREARLKRQSRRRWKIGLAAAGLVAASVVAAVYFIGNLTVKNEGLRVQQALAAVQANPAGVPGAVGTLTNSLTDNHAETRLAAVQALASIQQSVTDRQAAAGSLAALQKATGDSNLQVRNTALAAIYSIEHTDVDAFVGEWKNIDPSTRDLPRIQINRDGNALVFHVWGACHPTDCDWGESRVDYTTVPVIVTYNQGFALRTLTVAMGRAANELYVKTASHYTDQSNRPDMTMNDTFALALTTAGILVTVLGTDGQLLPPGIPLTMTVLNSRRQVVSKGLYHQSSVVIRDVPFDATNVNGCPATSGENDTVAVSADGYSGAESPAVPICPRVLQKVNVTLRPSKQ